MKKLAICIVNYNCLTDTKELVSDLTRQDHTDFNIYFYDQNSKEGGTKEFLDTLELYNNCTVIRNDHNRPLNHIWNDFAQSTKNDFDYIAFLNNDIRIPYNYLSDSVAILDKDKRVGIAVHATNNRRYSTATAPTRHLLEAGLVKQGWEFMMRREHWKNIPPQLKFYCGDDFIFGEIHKNNLKVGVITSSPVIHKLSKTRKNMPPEEAAKIKQQAKDDIAMYKQLGFKHVWNNIPKQSRLEPEFKKITEINKKRSSSKLKDYNDRLRMHLREVGNVDGCIIDCNSEDVGVLDTLNEAAIHFGRKLHLVDGRGEGIDDTVSTHKNQLRLGNNFTGKVFRQLKDVDESISFVFLGASTGMQMLKDLEQVWSKVIPGTTLFIPYYHYNKSPEIKAAVDNFFGDKEHYILKSRPQTKVGITDTYLAIKCFKEPVPFDKNDRPLVIASVLKSGGVYDEKYVDRLASAIKRHCTVEYEFVCLTDFPKDSFNADLVDTVIPLEYDLKGWWSKLELFRPELFKDKQVLYFDLDTLIVDNIDDFASYGGNFMALRDFNILTGLGSGILSWRGGNYDHIFHKSINGLINNTLRLASYNGGDQQVIEMLVGSRVEWVQDLFPNKMAAFKIQCYNEKNKSVSIPEDTSIVCFHGSPKMRDIKEDPVIKEHWKV
jgi:hypothetical protein